jgi:hypothetical protein
VRAPIDSGSTLLHRGHCTGFNFRGCHSELQKGHVFMVE